MPPKYSNTISYLFETALKCPDTIALRDDHSKPPVAMSYGHLSQDSDVVASGLIAIGIKPGDHVAFFADNQPRWKIIDYALLSIGAVSVPRGSDSAISELRYIIKHSDAQCVVLQNLSLAEKIFEEGDFPSLQTVMILDPKADGHEFSSLDVSYTSHSYQHVHDLGQQFPADVQALREATRLEDLATIVYTSGTTGQPKGVMLTHANLISQLQNVDVGFDSNMKPGITQLAMLPAWHAYERMVEYFTFYQFAPTLVYTSKRHLKSDIASVQPAIIPCVPRVWEMIYDTIQSQVRKQSKFSQSMFNFFVHCGTIAVHAKRNWAGTSIGRSCPTIVNKGASFITYVFFAPIHQLGDALIFKKIRLKIASNLLAAVSGGGSLATYIDDFFETLGITLLNGYGLTETSPVIAIRSINHNVRGTVGQPVQNVSLEIRSDDGTPLSQGSTGAIWAKGENVMKGYYKNQTETDKVIRNGWFNTGDLGWISYKGDLVISGRAKDTIVLSSGENIEPEPIEGVLRSSPFVEDIVIVGQDQKSLGALIYPSKEYLSKALGMADSSSIEDIVSNPQATDIVRQNIMKMMKDHGSFKDYEIVNKVALISEPFTEANGMLTQTIKPKRNPIATFYAETIKAMFS